VSCTLTSFIPMASLRLSTNRTLHALDEWPAIARRVTRAQRLAIFLDFDGTLAPIQRLPDSVRLSEDVRRRLTALIHRGHIVAIVSGRGLDDLAQRVRVPGAWYVGGHGFLLQAPNGHSLELVSARQRARIRQVAARLSRALNGCNGVMLESKVAAVAVHYRNAGRACSERAKELVHMAVERDPGLRIQPGKKVWDVLPASPIDKFHAVQFILRSARDDTPRTRWLPAYIGDDHADEIVFERMRGITVAVGRRRGTAAEYFVRSPAEVRQLLGQLMEATGADVEALP
jgi:trehalose-phosphatase